MPVEFPEDEDEDEDEESKDAKPNTELFNVLTLQYKVANKYESAAKSAEAYALLHEAATSNVQIQRVMKKHKSNFPLAFASESHFVMGNAKSAVRAQRKETFEEIRKCDDADAVREVIMLINANNKDLKPLGTDDELKDNALSEELMDVIKDTPSLNNVYHLARMPDTKIREWDSLTEYMISIIARGDGTTAAHSSQDDNKTDCIDCGEDDHAKQYEETQEYEQVQEHFKAMSISSTQPEKGALVLPHGARRDTGDSSLRAVGNTDSPAAVRRRRWRLWRDPRRRRGWHGVQVLRRHAGHSRPLGLDRQLGGDRRPRPHRRRRGRYVPAHAATRGRRVRFRRLELAPQALRKKSRDVEPPLTKKKITGGRRRRERGTGGRERCIGWPQCELCDCAALKRARAGSRQEMPRRALRKEPRGDFFSWFLNENELEIHS